MLSRGEYFLVNSTPFPPLPLLIIIVPRRYLCQLGVFRGGLVFENKHPWFAGLFVNLMRQPQYHSNLVPTRSKTGTRANFYSNRDVLLWNQLPTSIKEARGRI